MAKPFFYAIVTPDGEPYMSENCVCQDRAPLEDEVEELNIEEGLTKETGYRIVALYRRHTG